MCLWYLYICYVLKCPFYKMSILNQLSGINNVQKYNLYTYIYLYFLNVE